jgi:hypothetical protein
MIFYAEWITEYTVSLRSLILYGFVTTPLKP